MTKLRSVPCSLKHRTSQIHHNRMMCAGQVGSEILRLQNACGYLQQLGCGHGPLSCAGLQRSTVRPAAHFRAAMLSMGLQK